MARFDIYSNPYAPERSHTPYVLDIQNDHLGPLATRVVIPLRTAKSMGVLAPSLNPTITVDGKTVILDTTALAPVPAIMLKRPVADARRWHAEVADALDTLFGAY